tara:strand:+ start:911 stop:1360 length:450 start_codon:yes stop_codon:yes gene_type:complete
MSNNEKINLKLIAKNQEDLKVVSAYLQDSIVAIKDIVFLKQNRTFIMIASRFMWEDVERGVFRKNKRIRCALRFEYVQQVRSKNINQKNRDKLLECLAIKSFIDSDNICKIKIYFSGNGVITMTAETIELVIRDLGKAWDVKHAPKHKI